MFAFPRKIQIQTLNRCNFACGMCPYPTTAPGTERIALDEIVFERILAEVADSGRDVRLCLMLQNEPLLDKRFAWFVRLAHAVPAISAISVVTNGSALTPAVLDQLAGYERFRLTISVNASDEARYKAVHGRDLWARLHRLLAAWDGPRPRVRVSFVLDRDSVDDGRAFREHWRDLGYQVRFVPMNTRAASLPPKSGMSSIDEDFGHCHYPVDTLTVLADGDVILCCNDWSHDQRFGSLKESTIAELWNGAELRRLRAAAVSGDLRSATPMCASCDYPMRSTTRVALEALMADPPCGQHVPEPWSTTVHESLLREPGQAAGHALLVSHIDETAGAVAGLIAEESAAALGEEVVFEFRIGNQGQFSFGGLDRVDCPGRLTLREPLDGQPGLLAVVVQLDADAPAFQLLPWYRADWAAGANVSVCHS